MPIRIVSVTVPIVMVVIAIAVTVIIPTVVAVAVRSIAVPVICTSTQRSYYQAEATESVAIADLPGSNSNKVQP